MCDMYVYSIMVLHKVNIMLHFNSVLSVDYIYLPTYYVYPVSNFEVLKLNPNVQEQVYQTITSRKEPH
jgi:hypothetical protein